MPALTSYRTGFLLAAAALLALPASTHATDYQRLPNAITGRVQILRRATEPVRATGGTAPMARAAVEQVAGDFVADQAAALGVADPAEWQAPAIHADALGYQHVRFFQEHQGLRVLGAELYVHLDATGTVYLAGAKVPATFPPNVTPALRAEDAVDRAMEAAGKEAPGLDLQESGTPRLLWLPLGIIENSNAPTHLAWEVRVIDFELDGDNYSTRHYVDAGTGEVVLALSDLHRLDRKVFDCARYSGQIPGCVIDDLNTVYSPFNYYNGRSEGMPPRGPNPAYDWPYYYGSTDVDSLYSLLGQVHAFVGARLGLNGANNQGGTGAGTIPATQTRGFVHVNTLASSTYCPNLAAANTTNGNVNFCRGTVVPDIVGHEYGHITAFQAIRNGSGQAIGYLYTGQSGALAEAFCDVTGESFEAWQLGAVDFRVGATASSGALRDLANPHARINGVTGLPNPDHWYDAGVYCGSENSTQIYTNTTVVSHAFYLFAMGGTKNGCTIVGQGVEKMLPVFYRAYSTYFPQACTFNQAYTYLLQACADLYPAPVVDELRKALQAVELDQPGLCSGLPEAPPPCAVSGVADRGDGGAAMDEAPRLGAAWPNPMAHTTRIAYNLPREGRVTVSLLDVAGRLVRRLADETRPAGAHTLEWDGRDDAGRALPGGLYFYRLEALGRVVTNRLVVLK